MTTFTNRNLKNKFVTTKLQRMLKNDSQGALRNQIVEDIALWTDKVQQEKQSGLPPADFFKAEKLLSSLRVAEQVIFRTWNSFHTA